jgi:hypothetical protein
MLPYSQLRKGFNFSPLIKDASVYDKALFKLATSWMVSSNSVAAAWASVALCAAAEALPAAAVADPDAAVADDAALLADPAAAVWLAAAAA